MRLIILIIALTFQVALAETPSEAMTQYQKLSKEKDFEALWKMTPQFEGLPEEAVSYLKKRVRKNITLSERGWSVTILEEKIIGDCAVLLAKENKKDVNKAIDIDPIYLLKQNGEWKVLPKISDYKIIKHVSKEKIATFQKLEIWYKAKKGQMLEKLNK